MGGTDRCLFRFAMDLLRGSRGHVFPAEHALYALTRGMIERIVWPPCSEFHNLGELGSSDKIILAVTKLGDVYHVGRRILGQIVLCYWRIWTILDSRQPWIWLLNPG